MEEPRSEETSIVTKYLKIGLHELCAFVIIALATALRLLLIAQDYPGLNSDEGTMGIMALHIAFKGEHPVFFYGQGYMGSLEAYLGAGLFHLFGASAFTLRLGLVIMFALFLVSMYLLTSLLYTKNLALFTLVLLGLGSNDMLFRQLEAAGGYPETLLFGSLILLIACWLAFSSRQECPGGLRWRRIAAYGGWGFCAGLALWSDQLVFPFVLMAGLLLMRFCRGELAKPVVACLVLGFVLSLLPAIVYNVTVPLDQGSFAILGNIFGPRSATTAAHLPGQGIVGTLLVSLPLATGANPLCPLSATEGWPLSGQSSFHSISCTVVHGMWGTGFIILWLLAAFLATSQYRQLRSRSQMQPWSPIERQSAIRHFARLMLLASGALTVAFYALSSPSALTPWYSARYLVGLVIVIPAVLSPLWGRIKIGRWLSLLKGALRVALLLLIGITFLRGMISTWGMIPGDQADYQHEDRLIHDLEQIGATRIITDYWTCDRIAFQSSEQIVCSVLDEQLQPGLNRYTPYQAIVSNDLHPTYVFPVASPQAIAFASKKTGLQGKYQHFIIDGYVVYMI